MRKRARSPLGVAVLALTVGSQSFAAQHPFELRRGVIVDARRSVIYVAGAINDLEAIEVSNGRPVWASSAAALPLALEGALLAAQGEDPNPGPRLRIVVLDAVNGKTVAESAVDLPPEVRASVVDTPFQSFHATATYEDGAFAVAWSDRVTLAAGVAPPPGHTPPMRTFSGTMCVSAPGAAAAASNGAPCVRAVVAGGRGDAVTLKRTNTCTGEPLPDLILAKRALVALPSADGSDVLVSNREQSGYRWSIFETATGAKVGELQRDVSAAPFFATKDLIVFQSQPHGFRRGNQWIDVPLELVAVRLSSGEEVWHRPIRDLQWRGPMPPQPSAGRKNGRN